jgi:PAS domain S-box-containing protein
LGGDGGFDEKAARALELGKAYLGVENGHLTRIDRETDYWRAEISTDTAEGKYPPGQELDLETTYCRRTIEADGPIALHDAVEQDWEDDVAFEVQGLRCYHGTTLEVNGELYGTLCFVATDPRESFEDDETMFVELITRLLERELEREQYETKLTRQTNLTNVLNRVLRHNVRNEMTVIRARAQLMSQELSDQHHGEIALRKIDRLIELCHSARDLEKIVTEQFERQQRDVGALVDQVVEEARETYPAASFTVDSVERATAAVLPSFERALRELCHNAAQHSGKAPEVTVCVDVVPNRIEVTVTDNGPGLPKRERQVVETGEETPLVHGTGLGLWIVHWVVTTHGGTIETQTTDSGTTLTVSIPRTAETKVQQEIVELKQARDQYQAAFEDAFDAMVMVNDETHIVDANAEACRLYGYERTELLGRSIREFLPDTFDFDRAWEAFHTAGRDRDTIRLLGGDGVTRHVEYTASTDIVPGQHLIIVRETHEQADQPQVQHSVSSE